MRNLVLQIVRFAGIGFLNTAVDFAVFNLIASMLGTYVGLSAGGVKVVSFVCAVFHSYYWNKYWAFSDGAQQDRISKNLKEFASAAFLGAAVAAAIIVGSGFSAGAVFYLLMLVVLAVGEILLWRLFRLQFSESSEKSGRELTLFLIVSVIGAFINAGIVSVVTGAVSPQFGLTQELWTNIIVAMAIGVSLIWNFVGYKLVVFKR